MKLLLVKPKYSYPFTCILISVYSKSDFFILKLVTRLNNEEPMIYSSYRAYGLVLTNLATSFNPKINES